MSWKYYKKNYSVGEEKPYTILEGSIITEKATNLSAFSKFVFKIARDANKLDVKLAVEKLYNVKVISVNVLNYDGKSKTFKNHKGKRADWRKAVVTLKAGQTIDSSSEV